MTFLTALLAGFNHASNCKRNKMTTIIGDYTCIPHYGVKFMHVIINTAGKEIN